MKMRTFLISALVAFCVTCAVAVLPGCTAKQLTQYTQDLQVAQTAVTVAQSATTQAAAVVEQVEAVAATQPTPAAEQAVVSARAALATANTILAQAQAALDLAKQIGAAIKTGSTVDATGLSAFGPYGVIAGLVITGGLAFYKDLQNSGLLAKLETANSQVATHAVTIATLQATPTPAPAAPMPVPVADPAIVAKTA